MIVEILACGKAWTEKSLDASAVYRKEGSKEFGEKTLDLFKDFPDASIKDLKKTA